MTYKKLLKIFEGFEPPSEFIEFTESIFLLAEGAARVSQELNQIDPDLYEKFKKITAKYLKYHKENKLSAEGTVDITSFNYLVFKKLAKVNNLSIDDVKITESKTLFQMTSTLTSLTGDSKILHKIENHNTVPKSDVNLAITRLYMFIGTLYLGNMRNETKIMQQYNEFIKAAEKEEPELFKKRKAIQAW